MMATRISFVAILIVWLIPHTFSLAFEGIFSKLSLAKKANNSKSIFLESLDTLQSLNAATKERTQLVSALTNDNPTLQPGSTSSFQSLAAGTWSVVYAPHIYTMGTLASLSFLEGSGERTKELQSTTIARATKSKTSASAFDPILYQLSSDGTMVSHAKFDLPWARKSGWLSVSGTFSSQDEDRVCRVDFDKTWIKWNDASATIDNGDNIDNSKIMMNNQPYPSLESVPESIEKRIIQWIGQSLFLESVSVFPVSYLDFELIVVDFELLGTRICARKISRQ